jgi:hypothetical protein
VSEENLQEAKPLEEAKEEKVEKEEARRPARASANETCICGHRASRHTANRYVCQAPGNRKGYCPCMRFVARNSPIGKRMRMPRPADAIPGPKPE